MDLRIAGPLPANSYVRWWRANSMDLTIAGPLPVWQPHSVIFSVLPIFNGRTKNAMHIRTHFRHTQTHTHTHTYTYMLDMYD